MLKQHSLFSNVDKIEDYSDEEREYTPRQSTMKDTAKKRKRPAKKISNNKKRNSDKITKIELLTIPDKKRPAQLIEGMALRERNHNSKNAVSNCTFTKNEVYFFDKNTGEIADIDNESKKIDYFSKGTNIILIHYKRKAELENIDINETAKPRWKFNSKLSTTQINWLYKRELVTSEKKRPNSLNNIHLKLFPAVSFYPSEQKVHDDSCEVGNAVFLHKETLKIYDIKNISIQSLYCNNGPIFLLPKNVLPLMEEKGIPYILENETNNDVVLSEKQEIKHESSTLPTQSYVNFSNFATKVKDSGDLDAQSLKDWLDYKPNNP